tara:strand:+ start:581 stop:970 length:390 start_codon:yes stop_codon:yes gene_type:complete
MRAYIQYILVAVGLMSFCANTHATDGNRLLSNCSIVEAYMDSKEFPKSRGIDMGTCLGFIEGIKIMTAYAHSEGHTGMLNVCWPNDTAITNGQAVRVVLSFLRKNPKELHSDQSVLVLLAYHDAYPCSD